MDKYLIVNDNRIKLSNPDKLLWPELGITKYNYVEKLMFLSKYLLRYTSDRYLSTIRYPDGYSGKYFYQKNVPSYAPEFVNSEEFKDKSRYINLNNPSTLIWLGNLACIEYHISFNAISQPKNPSSIVFDLDPSSNQSFDEVLEVAIRIYENLSSLNITSYVKTSGATGLQVYIPVGGKYDYDTARNISLFFANYFASKYPNLITIERMKTNRNDKLYFDYLQMWEGKSIISPYSPRATRHATVSTPVTWDEIKAGITPQEFNLLNIENRINMYGDLFAEVLKESSTVNLDFILDYIKK